MKQDFGEEVRMKGDGAEKRPEWRVVVVLVQVRRVRNAQPRREVEGADETLLRRLGAPMPKTNSSRLGALAAQVAE